MGLTRSLSSHQTVSSRQKINPSTARKSVTRRSSCTCGTGYGRNQDKRSKIFQPGIVNWGNAQSGGRRSVRYAYQAPAGTALEVNQAARRQSRCHNRSATNAAGSKRPVSRVSAASIARTQTLVQRRSSQYSRNPANNAASAPSTSMRSKEARVAGTITNRSPQKGERPRRENKRAHQYAPNATKNISK